MAVPPEVSLDASRQPASQPQAPRPDNPYFADWEESIPYDFLSVRGNHVQLQRSRKAAWAVSDWDLYQVRLAGCRVKVDICGLWPSHHAQIYQHACARGLKVWA